MIRTASLMVLLPTLVGACAFSMGPPKGPAQTTEAPKEEASGDEEDRAVRAAEALKVRARGDDPIPDDKIQALESAGAALTGPKANHVKFLVEEFRREAAWAQPDADVAKAIAAELHAEITLVGTKPVSEPSADGQAKDPLSVPFAAKKGVCYTAFLRFQKATPEADRVAGKRLNDLPTAGFDYPGSGSTPLQQYAVKSATRPGREWIVGACSTADVQATLSSAIVADAGNAVRYVVVATPKESFPLQIATFMTVVEPDTCDTEAWYRLWTDPIPGSLVYSDTGEPLLVKDPDLLPNVQVEGYSLTPEARTAPKAHLTTAPPSAVKHAEPFVDRACRTGKARFAESVKLNACYDGVSARFDPKIAAMEQARDSAPNLQVAAQAEAARKQLWQQKSDTWTAACGGLQAQHTRKAEATFKRVVDFYAKTPPKSPIERAEALADQAGLLPGKARGQSPRAGRTRR
jgi:hypothetical protein